MTTKQCHCDNHTQKPYRPLTILLLDCWLREYDRRPYQTLLLNRKLFEKKFCRSMDNQDFTTLLEFLSRRKIINFEFNYMPMPDNFFNKFLMTNELKNLRNLSLCHVSLSAKAIEGLASIAHDCKIQTLRLSGNHFQRQHADWLRIFLLNNKTIKYLDIGYCGIDHILLAIIADGIINCSCLEALDFSRVITQHAFNIKDESKIGLIFSIILSRIKLMEFHCKHCHFDGHDIVPMAEYLAIPICLVYLDLGANNIGANGTEIIFKALQEKPHLIGLDISNNNIGHHGANVIAQYLPSTKIRYLDIGRNGIPADGMFRILSTINKSHPIKIFNIVGNGFDDHVGDLLNRQIEAHILLIHSIDVTAIYDKEKNAFLIVPRYNDRVEYNQRYHRVVPFYRHYDMVPNLMWHKELNRKLLVNGMFVDPIFVDAMGRVFTMDEFGKLLVPEYTKLFNF